MGMTPEEAFAQALGAAKSFTKKSLQGAGALNGEAGKSAYEIAVENGFEGTEEQWLASLKGEKGDSGEGTSYDDTEIKSEIADIWKANGELGAKNLIAYPYAENDITRSSVTWHVNDDGSIDVKGKIDSNPNNYSYISMFNSILNLDANTYTLSLYSKTIISNAHIAFRILNWDNRNYLELAKANTNKSVNFTISQEMIDAINNGDSRFQMIAQVNDLNEEYDLTVYPMLRLASDPDDTWQPPAKTNKELSDAVNELQTGLQTATDNINIRVTHLNVRSGSCNSLKNRYYRYFVEGSTTSDAPNNIDNFLLVAIGLTVDTITGQTAINANTGDIYYRHTSDNGTTWTEWASMNGVSNSKSSGKGVSDFDVFCDNIDIDYAYDSDTKANYTVIRVYKNKFDGTKQIPFVRYKKKYSCLEIAEDEGWFLTMTAGLFKPKTSTHEPDGVVIENGTIINNDVNEIHYGSYPLIIDADGNLDYAQPEETGEDILTGHSNIVSAVGGWGPLIVNYKAVDFFSPLLGYDVNAQRQIIGQFGNGDYCIVTCDGRNYNNSDGWTVPEAITICKKLGLKFAYNLDGGGSVETVVGKKQLNIIYENEKGRQLPTFLVFNGKTSFSDTPISKRLVRIVPSVTEKTLVLGETVSEKDYSVMAQYSDGTSKELGSSEYKTNMSAVDFKTVGEYYVQFEYSEDGITKTATSVINIVSELPSKTLDSISATKTTTTYNVGATVETSDIKVTANYADGTTSDITNLAVINTSNIDISKAGTYSIDISYTEDSITKTTSVLIIIKEAADASFTPDVVFKHGFSLDADNTDPNATYFKHTASVNNTRGMGYVTTENPAYINKASGDLLGYLIPIPPTATKVVVNSKVQSAIRLWDSNFKDIYNPGYAAAGANEATFNAGEAAYLSVQFKSTASTNFTNGYSVVFE